MSQGWESSEMQKLRGGPPLLAEPGTEPGLPGDCTEGRLINLDKLITAAVASGALCRGNPVFSHYERWRGEGTACRLALSGAIASRPPVTLLHTEYVLLLQKMAALQQSYINERLFFFFLNYFSVGLKPSYKLEDVFLFILKSTDLPVTAVPLMSVSLFSSGSV